MLTFIKRRQFGFGLALTLSLVVAVSYLALAKINGRHRASPVKPTSAAPTAKSENAISLDGDNDGIPDVAELQTYSDRENFRRWFTLIAEGQFYRLTPDWNADQRDCAGLVRFAWREALRKHDRLWFQKMGPGYDAVASDVGRYNLDSSPLGEKLFRITFGSYKDGDLPSGAFSEFADARSLKSFNTKFISRDRQQARPGDLLFFHQPWVQKFPYHVMTSLSSLPDSTLKHPDVQTKSGSQRIITASLIYLLVIAGALTVA